MAQSPVFDGLTAVLAHAGADTPAIRRQLDAAQTRLAAGGLQVRVTVEAGEPEMALQHKIVAEGSDLLVVGAYRPFAHAQPHHRINDHGDDTGMQSAGAIVSLGDGVVRMDADPCRCGSSGKPGAVQTDIQEDA